MKQCAARDLERDDDPVARAQVADLAADLLDDAHRLVPEDVPGVMNGAEHLVEVQVRAADVGRGDADDRVGRLLDLGVRDLFDPNVSLALPGNCAHELKSSLVSVSDGVGPKRAFFVAADLHTSVHGSRVEARLWTRCRPGFDRAVRGEPAAMPRAADAAIAHLPFVQRPAAMCASAGQRGDSVCRPEQDDRHPADVDTERLVTDRGQLSGIRPVSGQALEGSGIDADAQRVGEMAAQPSGGTLSPNAASDSAAPRVDGRGAARAGW